MTALLFSIDGATLLVNCCILKLTSDMLYCVSFALLLTFLCLWNLRNIPESPDWLFSKAKWERLKQDFLYFNEKNEAGISEAEIDEMMGKLQRTYKIREEQRSNISSKRELFTNPHLFQILYKVAAMWITVSFSFYLILFYMSFAPGDPITNCAILGTADIIGPWIAVYLYMKVKLETQVQVLFFNSAVFCLLYLMV